MRQILLTIILLGSFITAATIQADAQCTNTSAFGTLTAPTTGNSATITGQWAGEYGTMNSAVAGQTYRVSSSIATDYLTVREGTSAGPVIAAGTQPVSFQAPVSGTYYIHTNTDPACGTQNTSRTITVANPGTGCTNGSSFGSASAPGSVGFTVNFSTCSFAGEFSTLNNALAGDVYQLTSSAGDFITVRSGTSGGALVASGPNGLMFSPATSGTYFVHWNTSGPATCGTQSTCRTTSITLISTLAPPSYCTSGATSTIDSDIQNVTLNNLNNSSNNCTGYSDFTGLTANVNQGAIYNLNITVGDCDGGGAFTKGLAVYIDWNQDLDFNDAGEMVYTSNAFIGPTTTVSTNITVPGTALLGTTRMRVVANEFSTNPAVCGSYTFGETEDYTINVMPPPPFDAAIIDQQSFEYTAIPISQTPIDFFATAANIGGGALTNVIITTNVYQGGTPAQGGVLVASQMSTPTTLAPGASTTFNYPGGFQPNVAGDYYILHTVSVNELDFDPSNDTMSSLRLPGGGIRLTDGLYSRDDEDVVIAIGIGPGVDGGLGNQFEIVNTAALRGAEASFGDQTFAPPAGAVFDFAIWNMIGGFPDTIIATVSGTINPGGIQVHTLSFDQPIILQPGDYVLTVEELPGVDNITLSFSEEILTEPMHWVRFTGNPFGNADGWSNLAPFGGVLNRVPMVRAILDAGCLIAVAGPDSTICEGQSVVIGGNPSVLLGTGPYTYQWSPAAYVNDPTATNPTASPTTTTTFTLTVTDANGCFGTDEVTITVNNLPPVSFTGLNSIYCEGDPMVNLIGTPMGGIFSGPGVTSMSQVNATYSGPPVAIPDGAGANANANLNVIGLPGTALGTDIMLSSVCFNITHSWVGDIIVELVAPDGTVIVLADRPGAPGTFFGCDGDDIDACVVTGTGNPMEGVCGAGPAISGTYTAHLGDLNNVNNGSNPNGQWRLRARDMVGGDAGAIQNFTLTFGTGMGTFDPALAGVGTHTISYCFTGANGCEACDEQTVTVLPAADASITAPSPICLSDAPFTLQVNTLGGTFSGTGVVDASTGLFDPSVAGIGTHWVYYNVTSAQGCAGMDSAMIVIRDIPTANAGPDQTVCVGSSVIIGGTPTGTPGTNSNFIVQYDWQPTTGLNSNTDPNPTASPMVTTTYTVTVTDGNGCTDTDEVTVFVSNALVVDAGANTTICSGNMVTIGGFPTVQGGNPPFTYQWSPAAGLTTTTGPNPNASPMATTTYTLVVTDASGCSASDMITITVSPSPIADAGADRTVCSGTPVMIGGTPAATGGAGGYTYSWSPAAGLNATNIGNPMADPLVTTTYTLTVTDVNGCTSTDMVTVTINAAPVVDAGNDANLCSGSSVTIGGFPTATSGLPPYTYNWSPSVGLNSTTVQNPVATPTSTTTYTVTVTDSRGCVSSDMIVVIVNPVPVANAGSNAIVCMGDAVTIGGSPTASMGTAPYTYSWSPSNGLSSSIVSNPQASPNFTTTYTVTVTDANGCMATSSVTVTTRQSPLANAGVDRSVCIGESVMIGGSPAGVGGTGALSYSWTPSTGLNSVNTPNPTASPANSITYILTVSDANGCLDRDTVEVVVNPLPTLSIVNLDSAYCTGDGPVALTGTPAGGSFTGTGVIGSTFDPATAGAGWHIITYTYTDPNGCTNEFKALVKVNTVYDFSAGPDLSMCYGAGVMLEATGPDTRATYRWEPASLVNDPNIRNPIAMPTETTTFTLTVTTDAGCVESDEVVVSIDPFCGIVPPNTFTPDGDGTNETWIIPSLDQFPANRVIVFNRWGTIVHEQDNYNRSNAWDGGDLPEGTYFYVITIDHPAQTGKAHKGTITIIRN